MEYTQSRVINRQQRRKTLLQVVRPNKICFNSLHTRRSVDAQRKYRTLNLYKAQRAASLKSDIHLLPHFQQDPCRLSDQVYQGNLSFDFDQPLQSSNKMKSLKIKFSSFRPKMHIIKEMRRRLKYKFRSAVRLLIWMIQKSVKKRMLRRVENRRMTRLKTKVFEQSPLLTERNFKSSNLIIFDYEKYSTPFNDSDSKLIQKPQYLKTGLQSHIQNRYNSFDKSSNFQYQGLGQMLSLFSINNRHLDHYQDQKKQKVGPESRILKNEIVVHKKSQSSPYLALPSSLFVKMIKEQEAKSHSGTPTQQLKSQSHCQSKFKTIKSLRIKTEI